MIYLTRLRGLAGKHFRDPVLAQVRAVRTGLRAFRSAYRGTPVSPTPPVDAQISPSTDYLFDRLSRGEEFTGSAVATARKLVDEGRVTVAACFADALVAHRETADAGHLVTAIVATQRRLFGFARVEFSRSSALLWQKYAPAEYLEAVYRCAPTETAAVINDLVINRPSCFGPRAWFEVVRYAFAIGELRLASDAYALLVDAHRKQPKAWSHAKTEIAWLRPWCERVSQEQPDIDVRGSVSFALIDYKQPDRSKTSQNIGDHIQTLAALGHIVRHQNVRFHGEDDLVALATEMQERVKPERKLDTSAWKINLTAVNRDASSLDTIPEPTWALLFGWHMHPLSRLRHDFPPHRNLRPIILSFHCNKREMLTPDALAYLRRYGPVGCRDWTTVNVLLSMKVPAFFSGCLTSTVDTLFAAGERSAPTSTVYVDMPSPPANALTFRHSYAGVKKRTFVANVREADALLDRYKSLHAKVVTSRLHCYLPARSLGLQADFRPKNRTDIRFSGLIDIDDAAFSEMRDGMLAQLEKVMIAIFSGSSEQEVYQLWRDLCADQVRTAEARHRSLLPLWMPSADIEETTARVRVKCMTSSHEPMPDPIDVVLLLNDRAIGHLRPTLRSLFTHVSRPVRLWLLSRNVTKLPRYLYPSGPHLTVNWLQCDLLPQRLELALLPELLTDVSRVVVLPTCSVVLGDITELADWNLGEYAIAARSMPGVVHSSGFALLYRAAKRLHPDATAAHELYQRVHARYSNDFEAFLTDVLVLNLDRMREDQGTHDLLPMAQRFALSGSELLNFYAGSQRAHLSAEWCHVPTHERTEKPLLVVWRGSAKPWQQRFVARRDLWQKFACSTDEMLVEPPHIIASAEKLHKDQAIHDSIVLPKTAP